MNENIKRSSLPSFMNKKYIVLIFFILTFNYQPLKTKTIIHLDREKSFLKPQKNISCKSEAEYYEVLLFEHIYKNINKEHLFRYSIGDFTNQKSKTLNFFQACGLYLYAMTNKKYKRYILWSLERLYSLCSDAKLSELLLWNLACEYEKNEKNRVASEFFSQFKRFFPGSPFYWLARYKEIKNAYTFCQENYHDIVDTQKTLKLAEEFIIDANILQEPFFIDIVHIYQDLSLRVIKKSVETSFHYLKKHTYTFENVCLLGSLSRLKNILCLTDKYKDIDIEEIQKNKTYILYKSVTKQISEEIEKFFEKNDKIKLPSSHCYQEEHAVILQYIEKHKNNLYYDISAILKNIEYAIESYYELKPKQ